MAAVDNRSHDLGPVVFPVRAWPGNFCAHRGGANLYLAATARSHAKSRVDRGTLWIGSCVSACNCGLSHACDHCSERGGQWRGVWVVSDFVDCLLGDRAVSRDRGYGEVRDH